MSDFYKVRSTYTTPDLGDYERHVAEQNAHKDALIRAARIKWVDTLRDKAKLIYRAAQSLQIDLPELQIEACVELTTAAAISDSINELSASLDNFGGR